MGATGNGARADRRGGGGTSTLVPAGASESSGVYVQAEIVLDVAEAIPLSN